MYTATVSPAAAGSSLRVLVNTAVPGEILDTFNGRAYQIILTALSGTPSVASRTGGPTANNPVALPVNVPVNLISPTGNQVSIDEVFLLGAASTVGVVILVM
jgi:hypothetical protein